MNTQRSEPMRRIATHVFLGLASCLLVWGFFGYLKTTDVKFQISMATAYGSLFLLASSLAIGPWNVLHQKANPLSSYLRRDISIWAGILGLVHVVAGIQVHMGGKIWPYFFPGPDARYNFPVRLDWFGLTNYMGLVATVILVMLLCLSNNASIRALGGKRWKFLQRWNYVAALLTIFHAWVYQFIETRYVAYVVVMTIFALVVMCLQLAGFRRARGKSLF